MLLTPVVVNKEFAVQSVQYLSTLDYSIATKVSENVANVVEWSYLHDQWWLASASVNMLQTLDAVGSFLIGIVVWIVTNSN